MYEVNVQGMAVQQTYHWLFSTENKSLLEKKQKKKEKKTIHYEKHQCLDYEIIILFYETIKNIV